LKQILKESDKARSQVILVLNDLLDSEVRFHFNHKCKGFSFTLLHTFAHYEEI